MSHWGGGREAAEAYCNVTLSARAAVVGVQAALTNECITTFPKGRSTILAAPARGLRGLFLENGVLQGRGRGDMFSEVGCIYDFCYPANV